MILVTRVCTVVVLCSLCDQDWPENAQKLPVHRQRTIILLNPTPQDWNKVTNPESVSGLHILYLFDTTLGKDNDFQSLQKFKNLRGLHIASDSMTDKVLQDIIQLQHLEALVLRSGNITDQSIATLSKCKQLKMLGLDNTKLTEKGLNRLQSTKPTLHIDVFIAGKSSSVFRGSGCLRIPFSQRYFGNGLAADTP